MERTGLKLFTEFLDWARWIIFFVLDGLDSYSCLAGLTEAGWINFYMGLDFFGCQKWRKWPQMATFGLNLGQFR